MFDLSTNPKKQMVKEWDIFWLYQNKINLDEKNDSKANQTSQHL
jgi:hypothetical protein